MSPFGNIYTRPRYMYSSQMGRQVEVFTVDLPTCILSLHCSRRGVASVFHVWLEHFPSDFDEPKYATLHKIHNFVTSEMRVGHGDELAKKVRLRLDKFLITPFEDEGENLNLHHCIGFKIISLSVCNM